MKRSVLIDSSALLDATDRYHPRAVATAQRIQVEKRPVFITNYLEAEAQALLLRRLGRTAAREWLFRGGLSVVRVSLEEEQYAKEILSITKTRIGRYVMRSALQ